MTKAEQVKADALRLQTLESENAILKKSLAEAETHSMVNAGDDLSSEIQKIKIRGKSTANKITVQTKHDHKNISLWTKWGKRIGPMHPDNCIATLHMFAQRGIALRVDKPTPAQLEAFGNSAEGKKYLKDELKKRAAKNGTRKSGSMDKFAKEIAKLSGVTVDAVNRLLVPKGAAS